MEHFTADQAVCVSLTVNGKACQLTVQPRISLADALRDELGLTGTKLGCEQGVCGCCTVLVDGRPMRSCLMLGVQAQGCSVETVEGIASDRQLSALQQAFKDHHALQCGYCTAGFLATSRALLARNSHPTREEVREAISGNLCRCTGYETIVDAIVSVGRNDRRGHVEPEVAHGKE